VRRVPTIVLSLALLSVAAAGEKTLDDLRAAVAAQPASAQARLDLAAACEKAGAADEAQRAYWAALLLADEKDPLHSRAREGLLRLSPRWQALFDLEKELAADWAKQTEKLRAKGDPLLADLAALWSRRALVVDEEWCSTRDPLADLTKVVIAWKGKKVLGKEGVPVLELPVKEQKELPAKAVAVEAIEIEVEGRCLSEDPELEVAAQIAVGDIAWAPGDKDPAAPVWLRASRLGAKSKPMEPLKLWLRYYPQKGIGLGLPLVDPRMRGASKPLTLDRPLAASVRLESLLPRNKLEVSNVTLTLYLRTAP